MHIPQTGGQNREAGMTLPPHFADVADLEEFMTQPSAVLIDDLARVQGDIIVLGVGGKMGPTLARMARRAAPSKRIIAVARFSAPSLRARLEAQGIECISANFLERDQLDGLPDCPNVIFMAGKKFGSADDQPGTWAMNTLVPAWIAQRFARSRIVAFSTACVYPFVDVAGPGASEDTPIGPPPGEYANSCVGRERMFEYFSRLHGTQGRLLRLSYAIDMRYGVLHDIGRKVLRAEPVDLAMGHCNVIWQGDANEYALRALVHCTTPTSALNISGAPHTHVRELALAFGERFGLAPRLVGSEAATAWLVNTRLARSLLGEPRIALATMVDWCADWLRRDLPTLGKPTHFEVRDGNY
jgi:nucleoside-diphosphate-sugar epimerase